MALFAHPMNADTGVARGIQRKALLHVSGYVLFALVGQVTDAPEL